MTTADTTDIIDAEGRGRFEARTDGELAGYLAYHREGAVADYQHTFVEERFRGRGVGEQLARAALEDARHRGIRVRPTCPFLSAWVGQHPEYLPLVDWSGWSGDE